MKVLFATVLVLSVCYVTSEYCSHDSDCTTTVCGNNFRIDCFERDNSHVCTCVPTTSTAFSCQSQSNCESHYGDCTHGDHHWHCYDGKCRCSYFG